MGASLIAPLSLRRGQVFWDRHDPTQKDRQGNDVGTQYRGGIYYHSPEQLLVAQVPLKGSIGQSFPTNS